jgi:hypothetical protein
MYFFYDKFAKQNEMQGQAFLICLSLHFKDFYFFLIYISITNFSYNNSRHVRRYQVLLPRYVYQPEVRVCT